MKRMQLIGSLGVASLLMAGCATSIGPRAQETESLRTQVASLEQKVASLNQRIDEISQHPSPEAQPMARQSGSPEGIASIKKRSHSLTTRQVQVALKNAGFYAGSIDGKSGQQTREAIQAFQRAQGLNPDGVVGARTATALAKFVEQQPPSEPTNNPN